jgi:hypothetical protein
MDFKEKVVTKHKAYTDAGFVCAAPEVTDIDASFFSIKDGIKRKHTFTESTMTVDIVSEAAIPAPKIQEIAPEMNQEEPVPTPVVSKKKSTKKKKGE